jgi:glycosyltransferase involved in cell wall biosynthesis
MAAPTPQFTILLPVHRPPALLPYAVRSVLWQEITNWELFIICDGAPDETAQVARSFAAAEPRISVFVHPKGPRHGEIYRHQALERARGELVAQIADDDMWFPNHLRELAALLRTCDFGHLMHVMVRNDGAVGATLADISDQRIKREILKRSVTNFGQTVWGYRLAAYRALPEGWSTTPEGVRVDVHLTQKFLRQPGIRVRSRFAITSLHFSAPSRREMSLAQREEENRTWFERIRDPDVRDEQVQRVCTHIVDLALQEYRRRTTRTPRHPLTQRESQDQTAARSS